MARRARQRRSLVTLGYAAAFGLSFVGGIAAQHRLHPGHVDIGDIPRLTPERAGGGQSVQTAFAGNGKQPGASNSTHDDASDDEPAPAATFETVYALVREHYVDRLPADGAMSYGALRSMLAALNDPNASFLEPDEYAIFQNEAKGEYAGIGASLASVPVEVGGFTSHKVVVVSTIPGSPADQAGLRTGDVITYLDGRWILGADPFLKVNRMIRDLQDANKNSDTDEVARESDLARRRAGGGIGLFKAQMMLRGDTSIAHTYHIPSDTFRLTVQRPGVSVPITITLQPSQTNAPEPQLKTDTPTVDVLKLPVFTDSTVSAVEKALAAVTPTTRTLIVDLRGNAGGIGSGSNALHIAESVAALLAPEPNNHVFALEMVAGGNHTTLTADLPADAPHAVSRPNLAVLVNNGTAGAAEALAAALVDTCHARLVGTHSFGLAQIQSVYPLPDGQSGFTLVTGRVVGPKHTDWSGKGLQPKMTFSPSATDTDIARTIAAVSPKDGGSIARIGTTLGEMRRP